jgi:hypothetical protein
VSHRQSVETMTPDEMVLQLHALLITITLQAEKGAITQALETNLRRARLISYHLQLRANQARLPLLAD